MARLIFISPYMKGGRDAARLAHRTRYFATREGVQLLNDDNVHLPVTKKQQQYIHRLLRSFPEARELPEHEDYANTPNRQTAFALIAQIHEDFIEPMDGRENYLDYVANRPGVKALGEHGLWDAHGKVPQRSGAMKAPVGLLSDRTVLRKQDEGPRPDKFAFGVRIGRVVDECRTVKGCIRKWLYIFANGQLKLSTAEEVNVKNMEAFL